MDKLIRGILTVGGLGMFVLATLNARVGWTLPPGATAPLLFWQAASLTFWFIASMQGAIGVAMLWIGLSGELGAMAAGAFNLVVMMGGLGVSLLLAANPMPRLAIVCLAFAFFNLGLLVWARRTPMHDRRPLPPFLRVAYIIFMAALLVVGGALLMHVNLLPWTPAPDLEVVLGWMFMGDFFYFLYALLQPYWHGARAQLYSFLVYDLILIYPLWRRFVTLFLNPDAPPEVDAPVTYIWWLTRFVIYLLILIFSGSVALYYLFINRATRSWFADEKMTG